MRRGICRTEDASVFILSIWAVSILAFFALSLGYTAHTKISLIRKIERRDRLRTIAQSGVYNVVAHIRSEREISPELLFLRVINTSEGRPNSFSVRKKDDNISEVGYNDTIQISNGKACALIIDEDRKLNINSAPPEVIKRLLISAAGMREDKAEELANNIADWRDSDNDVTEEGVVDLEDLLYQLSGSSYMPKNANLELLEELLLVKGMTEAVYEAIYPHITIYGDGNLNLNTCSREVLESYEIGEDLTRKIFTFRSGRGYGGAKARQVFRSRESIIDDLSEAVSLSEDEKALLQGCIERYRFGADSYFFDIVSTAQLEQGHDRCSVHCVVDRNGMIKRWSEEFISQ